MCMMKDQKKRCNIDDLLNLEIFLDLNKNNQKFVVKNQEKEKFEKRSAGIVSEVMQNNLGQVFFDSKIVSDTNDLTHTNNSSEVKIHSTAQTKDTNSGIGPYLDEKNMNRSLPMKMIHEEPQKDDDMFDEVHEVPGIKIIDQKPKNKANIVNDQSLIPPIPVFNYQNKGYQQATHDSLDQNQLMPLMVTPILANDQPGYKNVP